MNEAMSDRKRRYMCGAQGLELLKIKDDYHELSEVANGINAWSCGSCSCISPASAGQGSVGWGLLVLLPYGLILPSLQKKLEVADLCPALEVSHISCCSTASCSTRCQGLTVLIIPSRHAYHDLQGGLVVLESNIKTWKYAGGLKPFEG